MSSSLNEILDRLNWARTEIQALEREIEFWIDSSIRVFAASDVRPGFNAIMMEAKEVLPIGIRARSGTITNEIRSCLDSLASALAERNGREQAYFPVAEHESAFKADKRLRERLRKFRDEDREALLAHRPFAIGDDKQPGNLLLYGLHHADIKRKHHRLVAKAAQPNMTFNEGYIGELFWIGGKVRIPGSTKIAEISKSSNALLRIEPVLHYAEPNVLRGRPLVKTLHDFADVVEAVVRSFL